MTKVNEKNCIFVFRFNSFRKLSQTTFFEIQNMTCKWSVLAEILESNFSIFAVWHTIKSKKVNVVLCGVKLLVGWYREGKPWAQIRSNSRHFSCLILKKANFVNRVNNIKNK